MSPTKLKIDYDQGNWFQIYQERMRFLEQFLKIEVINEEFYYSQGGNIHGIIEVAGKYLDMEILMLQLLLGDDWKRSAYNFRRVRKGWKVWNILHNSHRFDDKEEYRVKYESEKDGKN